MISFIREPKGNKFRSTGESSEIDGAEALPQLVNLASVRFVKELVVMDELLIQHTTGN
jgi:hypothetical protein